MKNLSLQKVAVYGGMVVFWLVMILWSSGAFAQTWQNIGNGYQSKVVGGFRDLRVVFTAGNAPYGVTDSLKKKADSTRLYREQLPNVWIRQSTSMLDAQEASVIVEGNPQILTQATTVFKMWYTIGFGIAPLMGYAESLDGISFTIYSGSIGVEGAHSKVIKNGSTYYAYTTRGSGTKISRYSSSNGISWVLDADSVIPLGSSGQWDGINFGNTDVFVENGTWHMIYEAKGDEFSLGGATSPDGLTWTKTGQILSNLYLGGANTHKIGGTYYLWAHSTKLPSMVKRFKSTDLLTWIQDPQNPTFKRLTQDEGVGMPLAQIADVELVEHNGKVYQYYTANPDGSATYSGGVKIKLAIANMPFADLINTTEDGAQMDIFGSIFVHNNKVGINKSPAVSPLDIKSQGIGSNSGLHLEGESGTNTIAYLGQSEKGSGIISIVTNGVGETIIFDGKSGNNSFIKNGNLNIGHGVDLGHKLSVSGSGLFKGNILGKGDQGSAVGSGVFFQLENNQTAASLRQQLLQLGNDGDLINFSYNGTAYRENYRVKNSNGFFSVGGASPTSPLQVVGLVEYTDNADALAAGLTVGAFYRTGDILKVVH